MTPIILDDASVLYPAPLRDLLMWLALTDLYQARWTDQIHDEWTRNMAANRPDISPASLARCRELINWHVPDSLITGYEALIPTLKLPYTDDRHVLSVAVHSRARLIVTFNLKGFPAWALDEFVIKAIHPDEFIIRLWDEFPAGVLNAVSNQRKELRKPAKGVAEYLETLEGCRLTETVARHRAFASQI